MSTIKPLKPTTIAWLRNRRLTARRIPRRRSYPNDVLNTPLDVAYEKQRYSLRTRPCYGGQWEEWPPKNRPHATSSSRAFYADDFSCFREVGHADEVAVESGCRMAIDHRGWYLDAIVDGLTEVCRGHVLQLPARQGREQYIPAVTFSDSDGVIIWPLDISDNKLEAARSADHYAKVRAEEERSYRIKEAASMRIEDLHEECKAAVAEVHELKLAIRRSQDLEEPICSALKSTISQLRREVARSIEEIKELRANPWSYVERGT